MLVNETEARWLGALVAAIGLGTVVASIARLAGAPADSSAYLFLAACGSPLVLVFAVVMGVWARGELSRNRVNELEAQTKLEQARPVPVVTMQSDDPAISQHWRIACHRLLSAGDRHGFSIRRLVSLGVVNWEGWGLVTDELARMGVMVKAPRAGWAEGWNFERWESECRGLPFPTDADPPAVEIGTTNNVENRRNTATAASKAIIDA